MANKNADLENSFLNPSFIGDGYKNFKFSLLPIYVNFGNNFTSAGDVIDYVNEFSKKGDSVQINTAPINNIMKNLKKSDLIYAGADITLLNLGINIHRHKKEFLSFQFSAREHAQANISFPEELLNLFYKGNKYYENQTINVLPKVNAILYTDYGLNVAKTYVFKMRDTSILRIKPAIRLRYLVGSANLSTQKSSLDIYTATDGRYIDATLNGQVLQSNIDGNSSFNNLDGKSIKNELTKGAGQGMAMYFGVTAKLNDNISVGVSLIDNGYISFKKNAYTITSKSTYRWEGYDWNQNIDSIYNQKDLLNLDLDSTTGAYKVNIASKLMFNGSYSFGKKIKSKRNLKLYRQTVSLFYIQGFENYLNATKSPMVSVAYSYRLKNLLNVVVNTSVGGLTRTSVGSYVNFGLGHFQFGLATNSLGYVISKYIERGVDLQLYSAFNF